MSTLQNSFIANVNILVKHLDDIVDINSKLTKEEIDTLKKLSNIDLTEIIDDLNRETYEGGRKIDIDLFKNYSEYNEDMSLEDKRALYAKTEKAPKYDKVTLYIGLDEVIEVVFKENDNIVDITTNQELYEQLMNNLPLLKPMVKTGFGSFPVEVSKNMVRFYDIEEWSNLLKVKLHVSPNNTSLHKDVTVYSWGSSTSTLEFLVSYINDILMIYNKLPDLIGMGELINNAIDELTRLGEYYSTKLEEYAKRSEEAWSKLENASATAESVPHTEEVSVDYTNGNFHFKIPRAEDGRPPIGLSVQKFRILPNGHLAFIVSDTEGCQWDAYINEKGELILTGGN